MTSVEICNLALTAMGIPPIVSLDDANNNARSCKQLFPVLRDRVLRDHTWSFATAAYDLQKINASSWDPRYPFVCGLPADFIRIVTLVSEGPYRKIGENRIFVETFPDVLVYIRRVNDSEQFDATFAEALQYMLAAELCLVNTRDPQSAALFRQEYERRLAVARSIDSSENIDAYQRKPSSTFLAARRGGCGAYRPFGDIEEER